MTNLAGTRIQSASLNVGPVFLTSETMLTPLANATLNVPANTSYNFLTVKWRARGSAATTAQGLSLTLNGDSGNNYLWEVNQANNTTVAATTSGAAVAAIQVATICCASATANYFSSGVIEICGASDTANFKTIVSTAVGMVTTTNMYTGVYSGQWNSAAAVTSITLTPGSGTLVTGSVVSMYGSS